eukprot:GFUD01131817.1.p1 GENE.GFUD01131817.1~~GFUD01131817.1.p1  ORF type:complete len:101 (+),score=18.71 GFUD01131817.1:64-366(+)
MFDTIFSQIQNLNKIVMPKMISKITFVWTVLLLVGFFSIPPTSLAPSPIRDPHLPTRLQKCSRPTCYTYNICLINGPGLQDRNAGLQYCRLPSDCYCDKW